MTEVIWSKGGVRIVKDDEPGEFPSWGDGAFALFGASAEGWEAVEGIGEDDLPDNLSKAIERFRQDALKTEKPWREVLSLSRWLSAFHNPNAIAGEYQGDCPGDRWLVVSMEGDTETSEHIAAYAIGDVWRLAVEYRVVYHLCTDSVDNLPEGAHVHPELIHKEWVRDIDNAVSAYGEDDLIWEKSSMIINLEHGEHGHQHTHG